MSIQVSINSLHIYYFSVDYFALLLYIDNLKGCISMHKRILMKIEGRRYITQ